MPKAATLARNLIGAFSTFTLVGVLSSGARFLVLPLVTAHIAPAEYGMLALFTTCAASLVPLVGLNVGGVVGVEYFRQDRESPDFAGLLSSTLLLPLVLATAVSLLVTPFADVILGAIGLPADTALPIIGVALLSVYANQTNNYLVTERNVRAYGLVGVGCVVVEIACIVAFVVWFRWNWVGRVGAAAFVLALTTLFGLTYFARRGLLTLRVTGSHVRAAVAYGAPLVLHELGKVVINQSDRIFLARLVDLEAAGLYSIGYQAGAIVVLLSSSFSAVYNPSLFSALQRGDEDGVARVLRMALGFVAFELAVVVALAAAGPWLFSLLDPRYAAGASYVFWIALSYWFWMVYMTVSAPFFFYKKTQYLAWMAILTVSCNLVGNYVLILHFGALGAAYSTALSFLLVAMLAIVIANRVTPLPWRRAFSRDL
ncbi:MAG: oligosaccharide flippase family protein [Polyangiaceae bacterium]|nr:oligosaccharide flippase family protein [Polyangiaceae bacterium]